MKAFMEIVRRLDRGQFNRDLETGMDEIAKAIEETGGSGKITLSIEIKRKGDAYQFDGKLEVKKPAKPRLGSIMFLDLEKNEFTGRDPRQPDMLDDENVEALRTRREREANDA
jgi:hypothetical protein